MDTGEIFHISEAFERVSEGVQPSSLRAISRHAPPKQQGNSRNGNGGSGGGGDGGGSSSSSGGFMSGLMNAMGSMMGVDALRTTVPLEPCLLPLPPVCIQGDLLTGSTLRAAPTPDLFHVGDGLAISRAAAIETLTWRRHRCAADEGVVIKVCRLDGRGSGGGRAGSSRGLSYTTSVEDAGCYLSVTWSHSHERYAGCRPGGSSANAGGGVAGSAGRAVSGGFVQVHPNLRDAVQAMVAAAKASFDLTLRSVDKRKRGEHPPNLWRGPGGGGPGADSAGSAGAAGSGERGEREASVRLDGAARTIELSWRTTVGIRRGVTKPLSVQTLVYALPESGDRLLELVLSARRSCVLRCATPFERDLLVLTLKSFLREWPPAGSSATPLLTSGVMLETLVTNDDGNGSVGGGGGSPNGGGGGGGRAARGASWQSQQLLPSNRTSSCGSSSGRLHHVARSGLTRPLAGPAAVGDELIAMPSKALHSEGIEFSWFRTARTGGRTLIPGAASANYVPTADDFGCVLTLVCLPYASTPSGGAAAGGTGGSAPAAGGGSGGGGGRGGGGGSGGSSDHSRGLISRLGRSGDHHHDDDDDDDGWSDDDDASSHGKEHAGGGGGGGGGSAGGGSTGGGSGGGGAQATWLFGKHAMARLPYEVRLSEPLEWKVHRICSKGSGEFSVRMVAEENGDGGVGMLGGDGGGGGADEISEPRGGGGGGDTPLTLVVSKSSLHVRGSWGSAKRLQCTYSKGTATTALKVCMPHATCRKATCRMRCRNVLAPHLREPLSTPPTIQFPPSDPSPAQACVSKSTTGRRKS